MKKLMIAAAIVCAAVMSQAAAINWSGEYLQDPSGNILIDNPNLTLVKLTGIGTGVVSTGAWDSDPTPGDEWNMVSGSYNLTVGKDFDGDTFAVKAGDVTIASYTLSGFGQDDKSTSVPKINVSGAVVPVPEPTSGLLLLLGVAGMALRRRRA